MNGFWKNDLDETCYDAVAAYKQCTTNTVITNNDQCYRMSYFNKFQLAQNNYAYGWLYFDQTARDKLYNYCSKSLSSWKISSSKWNAGFQFAFGTQSSDGKY